MLTVKQFNSDDTELQYERKAFDDLSDALAFIRTETYNDNERSDSSVAYYTITIPVEVKTIERRTVNI